MKTNKVTAIPRLRFPEFDGDWKIFYLNNVSHNLDSKRVPITSKDRKKGNIPYYGASGIIDYIDEFIFDDNLLCISEDGANLIDRVYPIAFSVTGKTWINNHAHVLKFENLWTQVIVESYLNHISLEKYLTGVAQPKLNKAKLNSIEIPLPKLKEQKKIAECLSSLDTLITAENEQLDTLKEYKAGLLQQLFPAEGETTPKLRFAEFKDDGDWEEVSLIQVCDMKAGTFIPASEIQDSSKNDLYPCYGGNGLRGFTKTYTHNGLFPLVGRQGALCGNVNLVEGQFHATEHALVCAPKPNVDVIWLYYQLVLLDLNKYATGQAQPGLSVKNLNDISLRSPINIQEQQKIADCLSSLDNLIQAKDKQIDALKDYKQGLMQQLFPTQNM